jgi:hypothetical protein
MTTPRSGLDAGSPAHYEIRVDGDLDPAWFDGLEVRSDGLHTTITGLLVDQPALHGLLTRIRDLGLCLISLQRLAPDQPGTDRTPT